MCGLVQLMSIEIFGLMRTFVEYCKDFHYGRVGVDQVGAGAADAVELNNSVSRL